MKAILLGLLASVFFAFAFVLNRTMSLGGGSWIWTASLRYLFMAPLLLVIVMMRGNLAGLFKELRRHPWYWLGWSTVGFGLFYAPLSFAAAYSPAWLVAGTWQFTIVAGSLLVPAFADTVLTMEGKRRVRRKMPVRGLAMSIVILLGIGLIEWQQSGTLAASGIVFRMLPIVIATFAYPLGNRKMMELCKDRLDAYQRVLGMTVASLPWWLVLSTFGLVTVGAPSGAQAFQALLVAIFSGVIATVLFFSATDLVRGSVSKLAAVEATQAGEVIFTLIGEWLIIPGTRVSGWGLLGLGVIVLGMMSHSFAANDRDGSIELS